MHMKIMSVEQTVDLIEEQVLANKDASPFLCCFVVVVVVVMVVMVVVVLVA